MVPESPSAAFAPTRFEGGAGLGDAVTVQSPLKRLGWEDLERRRRQEYVGGCLLAPVCVGLGDREQAISWLQQAAEERDGLMPWLNTLLVYDPLRSDPRFQALLKKMVPLKNRAA